MSGMEEVKRPTGIVVIAVLQVAFGSLLVFSSISVYISPILPMADVPFGLSTALAMGTIIVLLAALNYVLAYGLYHGRIWAWYTEVFYVVAGLLNILFLSTFSISNLPLALIPIGLLLYLYRPNVRRFFGVLEEEFIKPEEYSIDG